MMLRLSESVLLLLLVATTALGSTDVPVVEDAVVAVLDNDVAGNKQELAGNVTTTDGSVFEYDCQKKQSKSIIDFKDTRFDTTEDAADLSSFTRFILEVLNNDQVIIEVFDNSVNGKHQMKIKPDHDPPLDEDNIEILKSMANSNLGQSFVATSKYLGMNKGVLGQDNAAALAFHRMALWISKLSSNNSSSEGSGEGDDERRLLEGGIAVSQNEGSFERDVVDPIADHRDLACSKKNCCNNSCFGMCGNGCNCWSWVCGSCDCINDCMEHDYYCSCISMLHFWCVNVFWVGCGNGGWVDHCP